MESTVQSVDQGQYLTFRIAGEEYAIGILRVKEILQYEAVTRVPRTPPWIRGVINLRGSVVPVVDLAVKFGLPESAVSGTTCIVIVEVALDGEQAVMGVMADSVSQVVDLAAADIEPPPAFGTRVRVDFLPGMGKVGKGFVLILDIDKVLSSEEVLAATTLETPAPETATQTEGGGGEGKSARKRRRAKPAPQPAGAPPEGPPPEDQAEA
jgi:purine-binding chemotaxis protein CheW